MDGSKGMSPPLAAIPPLLAATAALVASAFVPLLGPLLIALALGAVVANSRWATVPVIAGHAVATRTLLRLGVAALGLQLPFADILAIGPGGLAVIAVTVTLTYLGTLQIGRRLGLDEGFVVLLAAGFSICGAAAIAAVDDVIRAKQQFVALAVAMVTIFGSAMIVLVPWLAGALALTEHEAAVWAGASIHEVAQVAAAGSLIGTSALAFAMTVKLGRVALLAPVCSLVGRGRSEARTAPVVPWFILAFAAAVALRSSGLLPAAILDAVQPVTTILLGAGMFGLGLGIRLAELWPLPLRVFALAATSTCIAAGTSLALILSIA